MALVKDDAEAQKRGAVKISYCIDESDDDTTSQDIQQGCVSTTETDHENSRLRNNKNKLNLDLMYSLATLQRCIPIRFASLHYFYSDPSVQEMYNTARIALGKNVRVRSRGFDGT